MIDVPLHRGPRTVQHLAVTGQHGSHQESPCDRRRVAQSVHWLWPAGSFAGIEVESENIEIRLVRTAHTFGQAKKCLGRCTRLRGEFGIIGVLAYEH